jgi:mRNA-degrading endonuclease YafQ of YafQ-DinJ toxin-antitoxin module
VLIEFSSQKLEDIANGEIDGTYSKLAKHIKGKSPIRVDDVIAALDVLSAAPSCYDIPRSYRPHPLEGKLKGSFATDILTGKAGRGKYRIVFRPNHGSDDLDYRIDNFKSIKKIIIDDIGADYHK